MTSPYRDGPPSSLRRLPPLARLVDAALILSAIALASATVAWSRAGHAPRAALVLADPIAAPQSGLARTPSPADRTAAGSNGAVDPPRLTLDWTRAARVRPILEEQVREGRATADGVKALRSICTAQRDEACLRMIAGAGYDGATARCTCAPGDPLCSCVQ